MDATFTKSFFVTAIVFRGISFHFHSLCSENRMLAKIHIVIPIVKQIMSALENGVPFVDHATSMRDMEENIWNNFNFDTLSYLVFVPGEQRQDIFRYCPSVVVGES